MKPLPKSSFKVSIKSHQVIIPLMVSSIFLLLVLQAFWLQKEYQNEKQNFRKQTHLIFRNTIFEMGDSLLFTSFRPEKGEIIMNSTPDSVKIFTKKFDFKGDTNSNVQVFISSVEGQDSIERYLKPIVSTIRGNRKSRRFNIRLGKDSLRVKDIEVSLRSAFKEGDFGLVPFQVKSKSSRSFPPSRKELFQDNVIHSPVGDYELTFSGLNYFILKRITPQILFSVFLTLLTAASFLILYRNLILQKKLMALKNDFISNITHELKTPITTVGVALEALKNFKGLENKALTQEYLEIAQKELGRLSLLTEKILKTAIFEDKGIEFAPEELSLDSLVEEVITSLKLLIEKNGAVVELEKSGANFTLMGSSEHLLSVVYNLLDNAIKYSPANAFIKILLQEEKEHIILSIKDNGIGIAKEYQKKIFEKFFRVPTGDVHTIKGYGLGLSYVESVIKSHGGTMIVESEPGKGSAFIVVLNKSKKSGSQQD
jgi:two-component system, OmpR family, phosphate regulon sensor histidine kinase PhoR